MSERPILQIPENIEEYFSSDVKITIQNITGQEKALWGYMTVHHALEHLVMPLNFVLGIFPMQIFTPEEKLERNREFLFSNYGMMLNFKFPLLPKDSAPPLMTKTLDEAKSLLLGKIDDFLIKINNPEFTTAIHPIFGVLDKQGWLQFQYKHFMHHFSQFGIVSSS